MTITDILNNKELDKYIKLYSHKKFNNSILCNTMEYSDFLQMVHIEIFKKIKYYDDEKSNINTYLAIIINSTFLCCIRDLNQQKRDINITRNSLSLNEMINDGETTIDDIIASNNTIETDLANNELKIYEKYEKLIKKDVDKKVLKYMILGYNKTEITKLLGYKNHTSITYAINRIKEQIKVSVKG